jgi:hypothetical protein
MCASKPSARGSSTPSSVDLLYAGGRLSPGIKRQSTLASQGRKLMKQELIWLVLVIVGGLVALFFSKTVRAMFREALVHPKQTCDIAVTENRVTVTARKKHESEEVKNG